MPDSIETPIATKHWTGVSLARIGRIRASVARQPTEDWPGYVVIDLCDEITRLKALVERGEARLAVCPRADSLDQGDK